MRHHDDFTANCELVARRRLLWLVRATAASVLSPAGGSRGGAQVPWVKHGADVFRTTLALSLQPSIFGPAELILEAHLHVLLRGVVIKDKRIITRGQVWASDRVMRSGRVIA